MADWQQHLERWERSGLIDTATADRIRASESAGDTPQQHSLQVGVVLALGTILLVGGLMLLVASHWDQVNPWQRLALVLGFLALVHILATISAPRFPGLATALHGIGTAGAGAAIFTVGDIFNMQEHWPTGVLLWTLCAVAGWWLLRDQVQASLTLLLAPTWVVCEWAFRAEGHRCTEVYTARMAAVIAAVMLTAFLGSRLRGIFWTLFISGALSLFCTTGMLAQGWAWDAWKYQPKLPHSLQFAALAIILATIAIGWLCNRRSVIPVVAVAIAAYLLPWRPVYAPSQATLSRAPWTSAEPGAIMYALVAAVSVVLAWWGLREKSRAVVNYAIIAFGFTILWFYFSSLMDKVGRSLGLIGLGVLVLSGGWALERVRRHLLSGVGNSRAPSPAKGSPA